MFFLLRLTIPLALPSFSFAGHSSACKPVGSDATSFFVAPNATAVKQPRACKPRPQKRGREHAEQRPRDVDYRSFNATLWRACLVTRKSATGLPAIAAAGSRISQSMVSTSRIFAAVYCWILVNVGRREAWLTKADCMRLCDPYGLERLWKRSSVWWKGLTSSLELRRVPSYETFLWRHSGAIYMLQNTLWSRYTKASLLQGLLAAKVPPVFRSLKCVVLSCCLRPCRHRVSRAEELSDESLVSSIEQWQIDRSTFHRLKRLFDRPTGRWFA